MKNKPARAYTGIRMIPCTLRCPLFVTVLALTCLFGCLPADQRGASPQADLADSITLYYYLDGMPQTILDQFTDRYGVAVNYIPYETYEDAVEAIRSGLTVDVLLIGNDSLGGLFANSLLAPLDARAVPNFANIDDMFVALSYDPANRYLVPFQWGTTGILVREDYFPRPVTSWNDLWDMQYGKSGWWNDMRTMIGLTLISLGYSPNSTDPAQLEAALDKLILLKQGGVDLDTFDSYTCAQQIADGTVTMAVAWAYDDRMARELGAPVQFVIPAEGSLLWIESFVIPVTTQHKATAEVFINFMLRPEIMAQYANEYSYAVTSSAARADIHADILNNPAIYPDIDGVEIDHFLQPLDLETQLVYEDIWRRFLLA
jgi:spermidine/putrescine transport system substrate-binding protein